MLNYNCQYITVTINNNKNDNDNHDNNDNIINTENNYVGPALGLAEVYPKRTSFHSIHHNLHLPKGEVNTVSPMEHIGGEAAKKGIFYCLITADIKISFLLPPLHLSAKLIHQLEIR